MGRTACSAHLGSPGRRVKDFVTENGRKVLPCTCSQSIQESIYYLKDV